MYGLPVGALCASVGAAGSSKSAPKSSARVVRSSGERRGRRMARVTPGHPWVSGVWRRAEIERRFGGGGVTGMAALIRRLTLLLLSFSDIAVTPPVASGGGPRVAPSERRNIEPAKA